MSSPPRVERRFSVCDTFQHLFSTESGGADSRRYFEVDVDKPPGRLGLHLSDCPGSWPWDPSTVLVASVAHDSLVAHRTDDMVGAQIIAVNGCPVGDAVAASAAISAHEGLLTIRLQDHQTGMKPTHKKGNLVLVLCLTAAALLFCGWLLGQVWSPNESRHTSEILKSRLSALSAQRSNLTLQMQHLRRVNASNTEAIEALRKQRAALGRQAHRLRESASTAEARAVAERTALKAELSAAVERGKQAEASFIAERKRWQAARSGRQARRHASLARLREKVAAARQAIAEMETLAGELERAEEEEAAEGAPQKEGLLPGDVLGGNESTFALLKHINTGLFAAAHPYYHARPRYFSLAWVDLAWLLRKEQRVSVNSRARLRREHSAWRRDGGAYVLLARTGRFIEQVSCPSFPGRLLCMYSACPPLPQRCSEIQIVIHARRAL